MVMAKKIIIIDKLAANTIGKYRNGNYNVTILKDGTKIRETIDPNETVFIPDFAENVDVQLTDRCSQGCNFCYANCKRDGKHGSINYEFLNHLHPYTEMALNGNDLDHPQLQELLELLHKQKIFANITVNQNQFMSNISKLKSWVDQDLIKGIGVSYIKSDEEFFETIKLFDNLVIHTVLGVTEFVDYKELSKHDVKVLVLGFKDKGRGSSYKIIHNIHKNSLQLYWELLFKNAPYKVLSFDNLAIEQLNLKEEISKEDWDRYYMGDDGQFTFFINLVDGTYAKNSCTNTAYPINGKSIDDMFKHIRNVSVD